MLNLKGITWNHSRGITPLLAASQRFAEIHPEVQVSWTKRSLQQFADQPLEALTREYDLLIIDHPWVGTAAHTKCVIPLDQHLPPEFLNMLAPHSVGFSHQSYFYNNHQWALSIDAATPTASFRNDLLTKEQQPVPETWEDVIRLAQKGKIAVPAIPIDTLMNFYTFCIANGNEPFSDRTEVTSDETGIKALRMMRDLYSLIAPVCFDCNPIQVAEMMTHTNDFWYCPFAYNYSNYSREGYAKYVLTYSDVVSVNGKKLKTTLGGTGIAVSSFSKRKDQALKFVQLVCSPDWQAGEYIFNGGQAGYDFGWNLSSTNSITNNFFKNTFPVINNAYMRPRYNGYLKFQDEAGNCLQEYLRFGKLNEQAVLQKLNQLYKSSQEG